MAVAARVAARLFGVTACLLSTACLLQPAGSACGPLAAGGIAAARVAGCAIVPNKARPTKSARKREPCMAHAHIHGIVKGQDPPSHRYPPRGSRSTASTI